MYIRRQPRPSQTTAMLLREALEWLSSNRLLTDKTHSDLFGGINPLLEGTQATHGAQHLTLCSLVEVAQRLVLWGGSPIMHPVA